MKAGGWFGLRLALRLRLRLLRLRMQAGGEAGKGFGRRREALAGARGGGFELRGGEDAQGAGVAGGEMLFDFLLLGGWEFGIDEGVECVRIEMGIQVFGGLV